MKEIKRCCQTISGSLHLLQSDMHKYKRILNRTIKTDQQHPEYRQNIIQNKVTGTSILVRGNIK